jgi:hypothetical protein
MNPITLKNGRVVSFQWSETDRVFLASCNGADLTDDEWNELDRILRASRTRAA